ncbi:hypothetical protein BGW38_003790, partial [Lunasporangiospora selenospora]
AGARPISMLTQSTGMISVAPTMSTMALSATSSAMSRGSVPGGRAIPQHHVRGGLENIWQSAKKGSLDLVRKHLENEPALLNRPWAFDGRSALSSACTSSQPLELVEYLIKQGAEVNSVDTFRKRTALHALCEEGGFIQDEWRTVVPQAELEANERDVLEAMRFLLDRGAAVDAKNHWKETALMKLLAGRDCPLMVQELYSRGADSRAKSSKDTYPHGSALCYGAFYGRIRSVKWMLENDLLCNDEASIKEAIKWASRAETSTHGGQTNAMVMMGPTMSTNSTGSQSSASSPMSMSTSAPTSLSAAARERREERKAEMLTLLESWAGEQGFMKRKTLARDILSQEPGDWFQRMSGIVVEKVVVVGGGSQEESATETVGETVYSSSASDDSMSSSTSLGDEAGLSKMPESMVPLWKEVQNMSGVLMTTTEVSMTSSQGPWPKWLTILRKNSS